MLDQQYCQHKNNVGPMNMQLSGYVLKYLKFANIYYMYIHKLADILANGWFDVGPTPLAQQALHMSTILF